MKKYDPVKLKCEICNSSDIYKFHEASNGSQIFKCRNCKMQFLNPQYTDQYLEEYYASYTEDQSNLDEKLFKSHSYCLTIIEYFNNSKGKLFDIGSGNGHLLSAAKKGGWQPEGYDVDCKTVEKVSQRIGLKIYCGNFVNIELPKENYDAVTMLHVIEHLKKPIDYLKIVESILKKGGILFIALPNIQSRSGLLKLLLEKIKLKRKNVAAYYDTQHHLWFFTPYTIRFVLEKNGFEVKIIYSGKYSFNKQSKLKQYFSEKILSKITWKSSMALVATKK